eukprot:Rmarinus@m.27297
MKAIPAFAGVVGGMGALYLVWRRSRVLAFEKETVASFSGSGLVFKDKIMVDRYADPCIEGISIYVSSVKDARLKLKMVFTDPSASSISVVQTGKMVFKDSIELSPEGEDILSEAKNILFKTLKVRRIYDPRANCLVYVSYSTELQSNTSEAHKSNRYKTSVSTIPLGDVRPPNFSG